MSRPEPLELICYLHGGWRPLIRPAGVKRDWMEAAPEAFPHRCLPLNIANAHGWELATPCGFEASWNGGSAPGDVSIRPDADPDSAADPQAMPVAIFGQGVLTFHVMGIFRTPPGWNLWVGGPPNQPKDAISPLAGIVETDWSPFTFTMNWRFTRAGQAVRFEPNETFASLFPLERAAVERFEPRFEEMAAHPELARQFSAWSASRDAFQKRMQAAPPASPSDKWQKHYYRGVDSDGRRHIGDHRPKLQVKPFRDGPPAPPPQPTRLVLQSPELKAEPWELSEARRRIATLEAIVAQRDWLLETIEGQRKTSPQAATIPRRLGLDAQTFLTDHYAPSRPVIVAGAMAERPALDWTPQVLRRRIGDAEVAYETATGAKRGPFAAFIEQLTDAGAEVRMTVSDGARNAAALAPLAANLGSPAPFLAPTDGRLPGAPAIGPAGAFTPLHYAPVNTLLVQVVGRARLWLAPPSETPKLANRRGVLSEVVDLDDPQLDLARFHRLAEVRRYDVQLEPGEMLFLPVGWWRQVRALDFSVSLTCADFLWPNASADAFPSSA